MRFIFFFFNDTATTEIYTLSLHDALPIWRELEMELGQSAQDEGGHVLVSTRTGGTVHRLVDPDVGHPVEQTFRSEEHTSELQSRSDLVCRLLLEKKKKNNTLMLRGVSDRS